LYSFARWHIRLPGALKCAREGEKEAFLAWQVRNTLHRAGLPGVQKLDLSNGGLLKKESAHSQPLLEHEKKEKIGWGHIREFPLSALGGKKKEGTGDTRSIWPT